MQITIGVQNVARELSVEVADGEKVAAQIAEAIESGAGVLSLTDVKGHRVVVPVASVGYVYLGSDEQRVVGFGGA